MKKLIPYLFGALLLGTGYGITAELKDLSPVDANNTFSAANGGFPENMAPSAVNNAARAVNGMLARYLADSASSLTVSSSSSTAYAVTANQTISALEDGMLFLIQMDPANSAVSPTLNVSNTGAKQLEKNNGTSLEAGDIGAGDRVIVSYDADADVWQVLSNISSAGGLANVVEDTSPSLGGSLDMAGFDLVDPEGLEFIEMASAASLAVNHLLVTNAATGVSPLFSGTGSDTNVGLRLRGGGTGRVALGDADLLFPDADGSSGQVIQTDGSGNLSFVAGGGMTLAATQATTTGTTKLFSGIPTGTTQIIVMFNETSLSGTDHFLVAIGDAGGVETSGYISTGLIMEGGAGTSFQTSSTAGFVVYRAGTGSKSSGQMILTLMDANTNTWIASHTNKATTTKAQWGAGTKNLTAELTQLQIQATGSNTFDFGSVGISYQ
jgi:hypothetical protein